MGCRAEMWTPGLPCSWPAHYHLGFAATLKIYAIFFNIRRRFSSQVYLRYMWLYIYYSTETTFSGLNEVYTVKRPKFSNGPLIRHPLSKLLKNHISAVTEVSDLVQRGERLYIFFWTNKKINNWGSPLTLYDFQQLVHGMSKLGFEKWDSVLFFLHEGYIFWGVFRVKKLCLKSAW